MSELTLCNGNLLKIGRTNLTHDFGYVGKIDISKKYSLEVTCLSIQTVSVNFLAEHWNFLFYFSKTTLLLTDFIDNEKILITEGFDSVSSDIKSSSHNSQA